tara:strand:+ start:1542 stop:2096 length:555 start_codon:yes stop_codon:yes gene_type:complete
MVKKPTRRSASRKQLELANKAWKTAPYLPLSSFKLLTKKAKVKKLTKIQASELPDKLKVWFKRYLHKGTISILEFNTFFREFQRICTKGNLRDLTPLDDFLIQKTRVSARSNSRLSEISVSPMSAKQRERIMGEVHANQYFTASEKEKIIEEINARPNLSEFQAHRISHYYVGLKIIGNLRKRG